MKTSYFALIINAVQLFGIGQTHECHYFTSAYIYRNKNLEGLILK